MAERLHVQHYHSTGGTEPTAANLKDGEIAVGLKAGEEKLFIKNTTGRVVEFVTKAATDAAIKTAVDKAAYIKTTGSTQAGDDGVIDFTNGFNFEVGTEAGIDIDNTNSQYSSTLYTSDSSVRVTNSAVTIDTKITDASFDSSGFSVVTKEREGVTHTLSFNDLGSLKVDGKNVLTSETYKGTITGVTAGNGLTGGGSASTSSTGLTLNVGAGNGITVAADAISVKAGTGITVDTNGVSISNAYKEDIAKGVSAYTEFNAFMTGVNDKDEVINTLVEIQEYIKNDYAGYISLLNDVTEAKRYNGTITGVTAGKGLTGGGSSSTGSTGLTISHSDTSSVATGSTFGPTSNVTGTNGTTVVIPNFKVDEFGHVVSASTITYTSKDTDTHYTGTTVVCGTNTGTTDAAALNGTVHLNFVENGTVRSSHTIKGSGSVSVSANTNKEIIINVPETNLATTAVTGTTKLVNGDLKTRLYNDGEAAAAAHTHSQYLTGYTEQYKGTVTSVSVSGANGLTGSGTVTSSGSVTISGVTATSGATGVSKLVTGDLKSKTYANGEAAAAAHTHSQYLTGLENLHTEVEGQEGSIVIKRVEGENCFSAVSDIKVDEYGRVTECILTDYIITGIDCGTF